MAEQRPARPDVDFPADVRDTSFYVLLESLYRRYGEPGSEPSLRTEPEQEVVLFKSDASIAFPGSDLTSLTRDDRGQFTLTSKFLGFSGSLSMSRYLSFLPGGEHHAALTMFIAFLLRDQFAWDLRLDLAPAQAQGMKLGDRRRACIGRTAFIGEPQTPPSITLHIRD
ncbi:type VI secretion system baseplate subunit TssG [Citrobacter freundii]|uniref:Type VI secretion system baseplate subunit TssG n=1 Tax=Citrobacter freundii TaxID=546 RepID=A0AA44NJI8_CITFR|nr:type VI secretion system baseplate subunit TssG [Citrobacter freundii]OYQ95238.1 hypothetical protein B9P90_16845 [Citrobacter freundii]OYR02343.1 hypothetical protein B9P89_16355 [Citrobacter freundii]